MTTLLIDHAIGDESVESLIEHIHDSKVLTLNPWLCKALVNRGVNATVPVLPSYVERRALEDAFVSTLTGPLKHDIFVFESLNGESFELSLSGILAGLILDVRTLFTFGLIEDGNEFSKIITNRLVVADALSQKDSVLITSISSQVSQRTDGLRRFTAGLRPNVQPKVLLEYHRQTRDAFDVLHPIWRPFHRFQLIKFWAKSLPSTVTPLRLQKFSDELCSIAQGMGLEHFPRHLEKFLLGKFLGHVDAACQNLVALQWVGPDAIVGVNWVGPVGEAYRAYTSAKNRPFGIIQHGFTLGTKASPISANPRCDIFYCWGTGLVRLIGKHFSTPDLQCKPIINPPYEHTSKPALRKELETVLVAPTVYPEYLWDAYLDFWDRVFYTVENTDLEWTYRLHNLAPLRDSVHRRAQALGMTESKVANEPIRSAIARADLMLSNISSTVVDSMLAGKPTIITNETQEPNFFPDNLCLIPTLAVVSENINCLSSLDSRNHLVACQNAFLDQYFSGGIPLRDALVELMIGEEFVR